jgi:hypothetical protein
MTIHHHKNNNAKAGMCHGINLFTRNLCQEKSYETVVLDYNEQNYGSNDDAYLIDEIRCYSLLAQDGNAQT